MNVEGDSETHETDCGVPKSSWFLEPQTPAKPPTIRYQKDAFASGSTLLPDINIERIWK
jgi:hypothetical protein